MMEMKDAKPQVMCCQMSLARAAAEWHLSDFNMQVLANIAWAFAMVCQLDTTMARTMSREVFEWIRGYKAICQI